MIIGGELTKERVKFSINTLTAAKSIRGIFAGHSDFFTIPPYDEKVDILVDDCDVTFIKTSGKEFSYEEFVGIVKNVTSFSRINSSDAIGLVFSAREILDSDATFFFPEKQKSYLEVPFFFNWIRLDFFSPRFADISYHVKRTILGLLGEEYKVFSNNVDDISIYNWNNDCIFISRKSFHDISDALITYGMLARAHKDNFIEGVTNFGIRRFCFLTAKELYKRVGNIIPDEKSAGDFREILEYVTRILSTIAKNGRITDLDDEQYALLDSFRQNPDLKNKFHRIEQIRQTLTFAATKLGEEMDISPRRRLLTFDVDSIDISMKAGKTAAAGE